MKLEGALPVPLVTATLLPAVGRQARQVVVHGDPGWHQRIADGPSERQGREHRCSACKESGHNARSLECPKRLAIAETKRVLRERRSR